MANATVFFIFILFHTWVKAQEHTVEHTLVCLGFALWNGLEDDWKLLCRGDELL